MASFSQLKAHHDYRDLMENVQSLLYKSPSKRKKAKDIRKSAKKLRKELKTLHTDIHSIVQSRKFKSPATWKNYDTMLLNIEKCRHKLKKRRRKLKRKFNL